MAAKNTDAFGQAEQQLRRGYTDMTNTYKDNVDAVVSASQAMISGYQALGVEVLGFVQDRMKTGLETTKRLTSCESPEGMIEVQLDFVQGAIKAYNDEFKKLGDMYGKILADAASPLEQRTKAVSDKVVEAVAA